MSGLALVSKNRTLKYERKLFRKYSNLQVKRLHFKRFIEEKNYINSNYNVPIRGASMATECSATALALPWKQGKLSLDLHGSGKFTVALASHLRWRAQHSLHGQLCENTDKDSPELNLSER